MGQLWLRIVDISGENADMGYSIAGKCNAAVYRRNEVLLEIMPGCWSMLLLIQEWALQGQATFCRGGVVVL